MSKSESVNRTWTKQPGDERQEGLSWAHLDGLKLLQDGVERDGRLHLFLRITDLAQ